MLSGLILLVIVGAWLAVLVPMALRSHDSTSSLSSVDRFSDAMRVLSRREGPTSAGSRSVVVPPRPAPAGARDDALRGRVPSRDRVGQAHDRPAAPVPLAVRRRRTLLGLLGGTAVALLGSLVVGPLRWVAVVLAVLAVAFVAHCRRQALLKAQRAPRAAAPSTGDRRRQHAVAGAPPRRPASTRVPVHVAGIPARMPARPAPLSAPLPAPAARHDEPVPAAASGSAWSPVPVPVPTYVTKPVAPPRRPRVLDLTKPGEWTAALDTDDVGLDILGDDRELDGILERRRAVGD